MIDTLGSGLKSLIYQLDISMMLDCLFRIILNNIPLSIYPGENQLKSSMYALHTTMYRILLACHNGSKYVVSGTWQCIVAQLESVKFPGRVRRFIQGLFNRLDKWKVGFESGGLERIFEGVRFFGMGSILKLRKSKKFGECNLRVELILKKFPKPNTRLPLIKKNLPEYVR
jgi:hypothetical protein